MISATRARLGVQLAFLQLSDVGPARGRQVAAVDDPLELWARVRAGEPALSGVDRPLAQRWVEEASSLDPRSELERHLDADISMAMAGDEGYPESFVGDPRAPALVLWRGATSPGATPACAVVGTRRCSRYGRDVARMLSHDLAAEGVSVVSGLALGIDGAAHLGALEVEGSAPVGVVACGLDVAYPRRHAALWEEVAAKGVLVSEWPLGVEPLPWRFPARNRLIAALGEVLVVVESDFAGGSMHTVREADDRGRQVLAVPGPVTSRSSRGTNLLISEGCAPCCDVKDVLAALGLGAGGIASTGLTERGVPLSAVSQQGRLVLDAMGATRRSIESLLAATSLDLATLATELLNLEGAGLVVCADGWYEAAR